LSAADKAYSIASTPTLFDASQLRVATPPSDADGNVVALLFQTDSRLERRRFYWGLRGHPCLQALAVEDDVMSFDVVGQGDDR
jgi:hypothetical protein